MTPAGFALDRYDSRIGPGMGFTMKGLPETAAMLRGVGERGEDMRPAMRIIKELMVEGHARQFATAGAFLGDPWPANAPGTLARKAREGIPSLNSPMVATGDLQESLSGGKGGRSRVTKSGVTVGTTLFYAIFHIAGSEGSGSKSAGGSSGRKGKVPARPPVGIHDSTRTAAAAVIERHVLGRLV